mmetsp:Transcript_40435/g.112310  ORF Transcript_40435/g.112310 Transcript_40435/m.112310 type:complete len:231 (+) Transcript_40435:348-1040(+)
MQEVGLQVPVLVCVSQSHLHSRSLALHSEPLRPLHGLSLRWAEGAATGGWSRHSPESVSGSHFHKHWVSKSLQSEPSMPAQDVGLQSPVLDCSSQSHMHSWALALQSEPPMPLQGLARSLVAGASPLGATIVEVVVGVVAEGWSRHAPVLVVWFHFQVHCRGRSLQSDPLMPMQDFGLQKSKDTEFHSQSRWRARQSVAMRFLHRLSLSLVAGGSSTRGTVVEGAVEGVA